MRVNELSKEIGKTNKEVLEILRKNHFDIKSHSSNITDEQAAVVRRSLSAGRPEVSAAEISKSDTYGGNKASGRGKERACKGRRKGNGKTCNRQGGEAG